MSGLPNVAIIELGSQSTPLIERTLRDLGVRSVILDHTRAAQWLKHSPVKAIILSGGLSSVYDGDAPQSPAELISLIRSGDCPVAVFAICYGMQWLASKLGGEVHPHQSMKQYGPSKIRVEVDHPLFTGTPHVQNVLMSHGDSVTVVPESFIVLARSSSGAIAAMARGNVWATQFHPEVTNTPCGPRMLANFLHMAKCERDAETTSIISSIQQETLEALEGKRAIFGFSGGVDSSTLGAILAPVLKERLYALTIDGGAIP